MDARAAAPRAAGREKATDAAGWRWERLALAAAYVALFSALSIRRHDTLNTTALDMALFDNILWNTAHGRPFESWLPPFAMGNYMADHLSPILLVLALPYVVYHDPRILLALQSVVLGLGAVPVGNLAERRLGSRLAGAIFAATYLAYPFVGFLNLWDFHQESVLLTATLFAFDFADRGRLGATLVSLAVAVSTKEEAGLVVAAFGLYLALRYRRTALGLGCAAFGLAYFVAAVQVVIPAFRQGLPFVYAERYGYLGADPLAAAVGLLASPRRTLALVATPDRLQYLRDLFWPLPAALLGPLPLVTSLPVLAGNLLSVMPAQHRIINHYAAGIAPGIVVASVEGSRLLARLAAAGLSRSGRMRPGSGSLGWLVALVSLVSCLSYGVVTNAVRYGLDQRWFTAGPKVAALERIAPLVPADASLTAAWAAAPHLASRRVLTPFPVPLLRTEYALVDLSEPYTYAYPRDSQAAMRQMQTDGYVEVARAEPFVLLRRAWEGDPPEPGPGTSSQSIERRYGDALTLVDVRQEPAAEGSRREVVALRWRVARPTAEEYGVRLRLATPRGEGFRDWWDGLSPRIAPWTPRVDGLVSDRYYLDLPPEVVGSVAVGLVVEPYRWPGQEFLAPQTGGEQPVVRLRAPSPFDAGQGRVSGARFGDLAVLERFTLDRETVGIGEVLLGALRLRALAATDVEYTVSVQMVGDSGLAAQDDSRPNRGYYASSAWRPGDFVDHRFVIAVPREARPGRYRLLAIVYDLKTGARLPVGGETFAELGTVEVR